MIQYSQIYIDLVTVSKKTDKIEGKCSVIVLLHELVEQNFYYSNIAVKAPMAAVLATGLISSQTSFNPLIKAFDQPLLGLAA